MKRQRQEAILKAVRGGSVSSQRELMELLARQGFEASQTTVSRDLRELGLSRRRDASGRLRYSAGGGREPTGDADEALRRAAPLSMLSAEATGNMVVIKTAPGNAQALAWAIDAASVRGVAGTVAGDDTILVVCSERADSRKIGDRLMRYALDKR